MSEKSLDKLINTLKSEAIEAADQQALEILDKAKEQAQKTIKEAENKSHELLQNAEKEAQDTRNKGESGLRQAARDLTMAVRHDLLKLLGSVLEKEVEATFTPKITEDAIVKVVENVGGGVTLKLPEKLKGQLAGQIQKRLQSMDSVDSVISDSSLLNGFSIAKTDQGWSYDISSEEVAQLLHSHLSPKWVEILKNESDT